MERIGVVGAGVMGSGVARTLMKKRYKVTVYNRTPGKLAALKKAGASTAKTPRELAEKSDIVIILVWNKDALDAVLTGEDGLVAGARKGQVYIDMSTQLPDTAKMEASLFASKGAQFLDAPVHGSRAEANGGGLWIMAGGERKVYNQVLPVLKVIGETQHYMGGHGKGFATKLCGNLLVSTIVAALGEALVLAAKAGVDPKEAIKLWQESDFRSPVVGGVGKSMYTGDFAVSFHLRTMVKDTELIRNYAEQIGVPLMLSNVVHELNKVGLNKGFGEENASAVVKVYEDMAKVKVGGKK
ncbi:MAG TPA: NAD(P)-dependent oxidoreductase [Spirochaetia bacterium]|nr:NAD(P)-dependent oxidoreductase [Spirochaetia bacterium]